MRHILLTPFDESVGALTGHNLTVNYNHVLINNPCYFHLEMFKEAGVVEFLKSSMVLLNLYPNPS